LINDIEPSPDLDTWISFVVDAVKAAPSNDVVLVAHSFSGLVAGPAIERLDGHVGRLIYLDANLPVDGESFADSWSEGGQEWLANQIAATPNRRWPPDLDQEETQLIDAEQEILLHQSHPMPAEPLYQRLEISDDADQQVPTTYVLCTRMRPELPLNVHARAKRSNWDVRYLDTAHWPMVSHPNELASVVDAISM
jgi:pimeloyl-ACP methyl ester carboxylesterase